MFRVVAESSLPISPPFYFRLLTQTVAISGTFPYKQTAGAFLKMPALDCEAFRIYKKK